MPRTLALAAVALAALTSTAAAKRMPPPPPGPVTITSTSRPLTDHLAAHEAALIACAKRERGAVLKATVLVRWDADGTTGALRVGGSTARFGRCATAARPFASAPSVVNSVARPASLATSAAATPPPPAASSQPPRA